MSSEHEMELGEIAQLRRRLLAAAGQDTPEERLKRFAALQQAAFAQLRSNEKAYQHFLRRNRENRRVEVIDDQWRPICAARRALLP